jgi:hypothetical protein
MIDTVNRLADRMLARLVPQGEAAACGKFWRVCSCTGGKLYQKLCDGGCNGIPVYCSECNWTGYC